jgi:hypothetical protein
VLWKSFVFAISLLTGLLLFSGCRLFSREDAQFSVSFRGFGDIGVESVHVLVTDGRRLWSLDADDFDHGRTRRFDTRRSGKLEVKIALADVAHGLLPEGQFELPIKSDWRWGIDLVPDTLNPYYGCFGCSEWHEFDVAAKDSTLKGVSLFVLVGGNSISNPVLY